MEHINVIPPPKINVFKRNKKYANLKIPKLKKKIQTKNVKQKF
jgi:hypothetical protein